MSLESQKPLDFTFTIPADQSSIEFAAHFICTHYPLPDLSDIVVLLPQPHAAHYLRQKLLTTANSNGHRGLLLPTISTLAAYLDEIAPTSVLHEHKQIISAEQRLLLLTKTLTQHRYLYGQGNPWLLAENLLQLFDELTLHRVELVSTVEEFERQLANAYRISNNNDGLLKEARIVHTLWQAWHQQLQAQQQQDQSSVYLQQLAQSLSKIPTTKRIFVLEFTRLIPAERDWLIALAKRDQLTLLRKQATTDDGLIPELGLSFPENTMHCGYREFLAQCYSAQQPFKDRIRAFRQQYPNSPVQDRIAILGVPQLEQQVHAISLFIRTALANQQQTIAVISEDRKLTRRLRALLERSGVALQDATGWAVSTTRAAAILDNWLRCVENDFPHQALLDLLKSPAMHADAEHAAYLKQIYRLEHDIILHENIASGLQRYVKAIHYRAQRLAHWHSSTQQDLLDLLQKLQQAATPLQRLLRSRSSISAAMFTQTLLDSLAALPILDYFEQDAAGQELLTVLRRMQHAAEQSTTHLTWSEYRTWLGRLLERHYFKPEATHSVRVQLLNLQQSQLLDFDAVVIAAADAHHLPGRTQALPFFNDAVRADLQLPDWRQRRREQQYFFRQLLANSRSVFITWQAEQDGETISPSPWVELLQQLHLACYRNNLEPEQIKHAIYDPHCAPAIADPDVPVIADTQTAPVIPAALRTTLMPTTITVSSHQRLIDCPYCFYLHDILQLKPLDEIRVALQKSDYGQRVHRCLHALHIDVPGLPGPLSATANPEDREMAIGLLTDISKTVFTQDIEDNFQHRGWLRRWLKCIPDYIDWQLQHGREWWVSAAEHKASVALDSRFTLEGRIDRIEGSDNAVALIDYKTGAVPALDAVLAGEDVQLLSYSLLLDPVTRVQYLGLDQRTGVHARTVVAADELEPLQHAVRERLLFCLQRIAAGAALPAFDAAEPCRHCDAAGVRRRQRTDNP